MSHIFISYSRKNLTIAEKIIDALAEDDLEPWIDWKSIPKGEQFEREIYQGIEGADVFLFLISPDSVQSGWCNKEIDHAVQNGKRILPIVIRDADPKIIHPEILKRNWVFCRDGQDDFDKAIEETRKTIHIDYEWLKYHTELQVKALIWEKNKYNSRLLRGKDLRDSERKLAAGLEHDPPPTPQQLRYLKKSRQHANRVGRIFTSTFFFVLITIVLLLLLASRQRGIALARQLAIQAQSINTTSSSKQVIATLLAVQSMKISPTGDAASFLLNNNKSVSSSKCTNYGATSIAFNSDGKYVVLGDIGIVRILEVVSGMEVAHKTYNGNSGVAVAYSPDGRYIASGSRDGVAQVWEVSSGAEIMRVTYEYEVNKVAFSPDGKYFVSGGYDLLDGIYSRSVAKVWAIASGVEISRMIADGNGGVIDLDLSPDGKNIISVSGDTARVWETASGKEISHLSGDDVAPVAFGPDGVIVASGKVVWDATSGMEIFSMGDDVSAVAFSPDGAYLVSGSKDGTARVWEVASGKEIARATHDDAVNVVAFDPKGKYVISGSQDGVARVWEANSGVEVARMTHDEDVLSVDFSPDGKYVVSGGLDDTTCIWELDGGMEIARMMHDDDISALTFNADGEHVIVISGTAAHVWDIAKGSEIFRANFPINDMLAGSLNTDGSYFVSGSRDGTARVWEIAGSSVAREPMTPRSMRRWRLGMRPVSSRG